MTALNIIDNIDISHKSIMEIMEIITITAKCDEVVHNHETIAWLWLLIISTNPQNGPSHMLKSLKLWIFPVKAGKKFEAINARPTLKSTSQHIHGLLRDVLTKVSWSITCIYAMQTHSDDGDRAEASPYPSVDVARASREPRSLYDLFRLAQHIVSQPCQGTGN